MIGQIKLRMVVDAKLKETHYQAYMEKALRTLAEEIERLTEKQTGLAWSVVFHEYKEEDIDWISTTYDKKPFYIPKAYWVKQMNDQYDSPNTSVQLVISPDHWKDPDFVIGGINYFQTQVIHPAPRWRTAAWKVTIEHELLHHLDNRGVEFGIDFAKAIGKNRKGDVVKNWDFNVVHETYKNSTTQINEFDYVWDQLVEEIAIIYPYEDMIVDKPKLVQITNELLLREPIAGEEEAFVGREEDIVRAEIGEFIERWDIINVVNAARKVRPL